MFVRFSCAMVVVPVSVSVAPVVVAAAL